ncbi:MAG TPA: DUF2182 domain-containing protein [Solirubrobacterales bacterium]
MTALRATRQRPALWVEAGAVFSWLLLAVAMGEGRGDASGGSGSFWGEGPLWICTTGLTHVATAGHGGEGPTLQVAALATGAPILGLMTAAMMLPTAMPVVKHVAVNSLYWRRQRATLEFLCGYLGIWLGFTALVLLPLSAAVPATGVTLAVALTIAAAWQLTPLKWRALRACHRPSPLPAHGWRATAGAVRFGLRNGAACVASCWAMMAAVALVSSSMLVWMAAVTAIVTLEKLSQKPRQTARRVALPLVAAAIGVALATVVG